MKTVEVRIIENHSVGEDEWSSESTVYNSKSSDSIESTIYAFVNALRGIGYHEVSIKDYIDIDSLNNI